MTHGTKRLLIVIGTRPEAIKLAPIVLQAKDSPERFDVRVVTTGQHREMLDQMLEEFEITADQDLDIMRPDQDLAHVTSTALDRLHTAIGELEPDCVIVQGDTSTTFAGALAAFYRRVPVAHVEAGLRTYDKSRPFPEEINRCLTSQIADYHFAPTDGSRENLLREGVAGERVWVTGNTAIDALLLTLKRTTDEELASPDHRTLLMTAHRRENQGAPLGHVCDAILELLERFPDLQVTYPVHLSPSVRRTVFPKLEGHERIQLIEPLPYREFVVAMSRAHLILTDSGGVQEEAPSLGKPVLVLRESTERPEAVQAGTARLVGVDRGRIVEEASRLLGDDGEYEAMARAANPYGDGTAARQILDILGRT